VTTTSGGLDIQLFDQHSPRAAELLRELHDGVFRLSFQPRLRGDLPRGYHMLLGVIPPAGETLPPAIPAGPVRAFLRGYFQDCEGGAVHDDAEVRRLLDACGGSGLEVVSIEDLSRIPDGS
jgi:hypothetical protein